MPTDAVLSLASTRCWVGFGAAIPATSPPAIAPATSTAPIETHQRIAALPSTSAADLKFLHRCCEFVQELQIEKRHLKHRVASAPFASEVRVRVHARNH